MARKFKFPIPKDLPATCDDCGARLQWKPVTELDSVIGIEKVMWYQAECGNGHAHYRDGRGQQVEPPTENLAPDRSEVGHSPQGDFQYSGYLEFVKQEREKAAALEAKRAAAAAAPAAPAAAAPAAATEPAVATAPAATDAPATAGAPSAPPAPAAPASAEEAPPA